MIYRWAALLIFMPSFAFGTEVNGRVNFGAYVATEQFFNDDGGSTSNDFEVFSTEFYLKATHIGDSKWEFTADLRDKNDFFGMPNTERLQLDNRNSFQAQEFAVKSNGERFAYTFGRFHVMEAGVDGVDGARIEFKKTAEWTASAFTGSNAKTVDEYYYQFNPDTNITGISATYQPKDTDWRRNLYMTQGFVTNSQEGYLDRAYAFQNTIYQWSPRDRVISLLYLDFVPRVFVQNGNVTWQQGINQKWSMQVNAYAVDVITYSHLQDVREQLASSPYKEGSVKLDYNPTPLGKYELGLSDGERDADGLTRQEYYVGYEQNRIFSRHIDAFLRVGGRSNFVSNDVFSHLYVGYYSTNDEIDFDAEYGVQYYRTDGYNKHPLTVDVSYSHFFRRDLYGMLSVESDTDEMVNVLSGFFRIGYRFGGGGENVPRKDATPLRGNL